MSYSLASEGGVMPEPEEAPAPPAKVLGSRSAAALAGASVLLLLAGAAWMAPRGLKAGSVEEVMMKSATSCSANGQNCMASKCCTDADSACFKKNEHWASCNRTCSHKMMWENGGWRQKPHHVWDCHMLSAPRCSKNGENCENTKCCLDAGETCYKKHDGWAMCNRTCSTDMMWTQSGWAKQNHPVWKCEDLSKQSTSPCVPDGQDCRASKCCLKPGSSCYKKNEHWASCNQTCSEDMKWGKSGWQLEAGSKTWQCGVLA